jgi:drug/metabolite transporter (DMT)-like permease
MFPKVSNHGKAILLALFVTVLWSSSWVLVKLGLQDIPPLTFAGLRYTLAFLVLLPAALLNSSRRNEINDMKRRDWLRLIILGFILYTATQGLIFVSLVYLQAATLSLLLNFSPILVTLLGVFFLGEIPNVFQRIGILVFLSGAALYFYPFHSKEPLIGLMVGVVVVIANSVSAIMGRDINRSHTLNPITVTVVSMGAGGITLLVLGTWLQGLPRLDLLSWGIIAWLAVVNSAFAFTLWNATQRTLSATDSSIINNTMLIQIPIYAWVFLAERLTLIEIGGLVLAALGILFVQLHGSMFDKYLKRTETLSS